MSNDIIENTPGADKLRTYSIIVYGLYALSLASGVSVLAGVVMAYIKRDEMEGTIYRDHMQYLIKTFWYSLLGAVIGWLSLVLLIGGLILLVTGVWFVYRVVAGFVKLYDGKPVSPDGWL